MSGVLGTAEIRVNGEVIDQLPESELKFGGYQREAQAYARSVRYTKKLEPGSIKLTVPHDKDFTVDKWRDLEGAAILFKADTGQQYVIANCFQTGEITVKENDGGKVSVEVTCSGIQQV